MSSQEAGGPGPPESGDEAEELLRRALLDAHDAAAVALRVSGLPVSNTVTVIFHGRRDLGTVQTYVAQGRRGAGNRVGADELLRVPCDLDLGDAEDREQAERLYADQASVLRDALVGADTVLAIWREALAALTGSSVAVQRPRSPALPLPVHRLLPCALVAPDRGIVVAAVCGARTLAEGRPPLGIACAQQDVARVYPLPEDPESCLDDFISQAADHARHMAVRLSHQEASVRRFLELSAEESPPGPDRG